MWGGAIMFRLALVACGVTALACSDSSDPFAPDAGGGPIDVGGSDAAAGGAADARPTNPGDPDAAPGGASTCAPIPSRFVVFGDSIADCTTIGGDRADVCSLKIVHGYLAATYAPGVTYENLAVGGAVTQDVPDRQLLSLQTGMPGHVLVNIYVGGNDLQPYIFISDAAALQRYATDKPRLLREWDRIFAFFDDATRFPDGVTIIMNTQYNPFDDCTAPPYNLSAVKIDLLGQFNDELRRLGSERANVVLTDQHTPYLGHGHHYAVETCPFYKPGAEAWMGDLIHPNVVGHANLARQWEATVDQLYGGDCD
jgi:lysophospholipase L1-like esterase